MESNKKSNKSGVNRYEYIIFRAYICAIFLTICLLVLHGWANARAPNRGTSDRYRFSRFYYQPESGEVYRAQTLTTLGNKNLSWLLKRLFVAILAVCAAASLTACGDDNENMPGGNGTTENPENRVLEGTKWTDRSFDFDIADDLSWGYAFTDVTNIYFYSNSIGVFYYSRKTTDSDTGKSRDTQVCFFTYSVKNSIVELEPLTATLPEFAYQLTLRNNKIIWGDAEMAKSTISGQDRAWINEITGTTGGCQWYYDMKATLYIVGNGPTADYSSYKNTPWSKHDIAKVEISEDVTKIGNNAFAVSTLGELDFEGKAITEIGTCAFKGATIGKLYLPDNIKAIGDDAFADCRYANITLPSGIETVGEGSFSDCRSVRMSNTKKLRKIGKLAFSGTDIDAWTDSEVLEYIGTGAVNLDKSSISLPAIKELGNLAVTGKKLNTIHIGNSLKTVLGSPFVGATTGKLYINQTTPLSLNNDIIGENVMKWTLYVPKGSESAYKKAAYWKNFKSVVGTAELDGAGDGAGDNESGDELVSSLTVTPRAFTATIAGSFTSWASEDCSDFEFQYDTSYGLTDKRSVKLDSPDFTVVIENLEAEKEYYYRIVAKDKNNHVVGGEIKSFTTKASQVPTSCTYIIDGKTFKMIKVTGFASGDFYIMQTEVMPASSFTISNYAAGKLDRNLDNVVIKAELMEFLRGIRNATDIDFRLPTSAEWKYAAKGGQYSRNYKYSGSNTLSDVGWYKENSDGAVHVPAKLAPNELNIYDMSGNYGEVVHTTGDMYNVDGNVYGGWYSCKESSCTIDSYISQPTEGKVPGSTKSEKNAFNAKYYTIRLVYSAR